MRTFLRLLIAAAAPALAQSTAGTPTPPPPPPAGVATMSLDSAPAPSPATIPGRKVRLLLSDGQTLACDLVSEAPEQVVVRVSGGAPFVVSRSSIRSIEDADARIPPERWFRDPNITRSFYAPTGFMLRKGEGYFSQKELIFSSFGYGITDNISVLFGSVVPTWFVSSGQNLVGGIKIGGDFGEMWHLGAGAQGFVLPFTGTFSGGAPFGFAMVFGTATVGTPLLNATFSVGEGIGNVGGPLFANTPIVVASGSWRVAPNVALQTENWLFPTINMGSPNAEPFLMVNSIGVRLMNQYLAADLGFVRIPNTPIPIPWVDFTYTFGG